jgi:hypothetical protein
MAYRDMPWRISWMLLVVGLATWLTGCSGQSGMARLSPQTYTEKCTGSWAGQMVGVTYGEPYQFQSNGRPILTPLAKWQPERVEGALRQDDVYTELTFLAALEKHGLDVTAEQAGRLFADAPYPLWHANLYGRQNIRKGIMPPLSGAPPYNRHCDDIDFQMEADLFGVICPGLPRESNRLCNLFGHIMNYGDGVYGGMFVAGMYTEAFFENDDVMKVIRAGLACIPPQSKYHQCISDTILWSRENPNDWVAVWQKVEQKYNDDIDCMPGNPYNIDARLNGAYIVIGLIYGQGDLMTTMDICVRCGQDADTSTANAAGIIGCMKGYHGLDPRILEGLPGISDRQFLGSEYTPQTVVAACRRMAESIIQRNGGQVLDDAYLIPRQKPAPPARLEQWEDEARQIRTPVTMHEVELWDRKWRVVRAEREFKGGHYPAAYGRENVLMISPITPESPAAIETWMRVPETPHPELTVEVASDGQHGDFLLKIVIDNKLAKQIVVNTQGQFVAEKVSIDAPSGTAIQVRLEFHANDWAVNAGYLREVKIE